MKKMTQIAGGVLAATFLLTACGSYDRAEFIVELQETDGVDEAIATCIADGLEVEIGEDRLNARGNPTEEEEAVMIDVMTDCFLAG